MKGTYRIYAQRRLAPFDWELVSSADNADEAWAKASRWETNDQVVAVRVDLCVRHFDRRETVALSQDSGRES